MARGRCDEIAALLRKQTSNRARILAPQRFAGQDHDTGVDVLRVNAAFLVGVLDNRAKLVVVDPFLALIWRQRNG